MAEIHQSTSRSALKECTREWTEAPTNPTEAYHAFRAHLGRTAYLYTTYLSTVITNGGYKLDPNLTSREVIAKNSEVALEYADTLHDEKLIDLESSVDAVSLGYIPSWTQSDYLEFWFHVMSRPDFISGNSDALREYENRKAKATGVNFDVFNDSSLSHDRRRPEYLAYVEQYLDCLGEAPLQPIGQAVQLIDRKLSLGGDAEASLARKIGAKVCAPALITYYTDPGNFAWKNPQLGEHLRELDALGAVVLEPLSRTQLTLVEERF